MMRDHFIMCATLHSALAVWPASPSGGTGTGLGSAASYYAGSRVRHAGAHVAAACRLLHSFPDLFCRALLAFISACCDQPFLLVDRGAGCILWVSALAV